MKTIEERAQEKAKEAAKVWIADTMETVNEAIDPVREGYFLSGCNWMREELTRWNDPKEVPSEFCKDVLVKYRMPSGKVVITAAWRAGGDSGGYSWTICGTSTLINDSMILGWREIPE